MLKNQLRIFYQAENEGIILIFHLISNTKQQKEYNDISKYENLINHISKNRKLKFSTPVGILLCDVFFKYGN